MKSLLKFDNWSTIYPLPYMAVGIGLLREAAQPHPLRFFCVQCIAFLYGRLYGAVARLAGASPVDQLHTVRLLMIDSIWWRVYNLLIREAIMENSISIQSPTQKIALYRHFDADNQLLYIGISLSAIDRFDDHIKTSEWAFESVRMESQWFESREEALVAEKEAIKNEHPKHNKTHSKINPKKQFVLSNNSQVFQFQNHSLRVFTDQNGDPWFIAIDVAEILEYSDAHKMTIKLDEDEIQNRQIGGFGNRGVNLINESGLYTCVLTSQKPEAKTFKRWITHEILPSIRKTGSYTKPKNGNIPFEEVLSSKKELLPFQRIQTNLLTKLYQISPQLGQSYMLECGVTPDYVNHLLTTLGNAAPLLGATKTKTESAESLVSRFMADWQAEVIEAPFIPCLGRQVIRLLHVWLTQNGIENTPANNLLMAAIYQNPLVYRKRIRVGVNLVQNSILLIYGNKPPIDIQINDWLQENIERMEIALKVLEENNPHV